MTRLAAELQRLYGAQPGQADPQGGVRAFVLELARPASWDALGPVWRGVQADLGLPSPGIAVSGSDGYQLWFSLSAPVPEALAASFLEALRRRYLVEVAPERIAIRGAVAPPVEVAPGRWSAFVAPDLAALFAQEPWLDMPPGADAQSDLLSHLRSMHPDELGGALDRLGHATAQAAQAPERQLDPKSFLLDVMNDRSLDMRLRIEAAKALLQA